MPPKVAKPNLKKKQNGYKMPDPLPQGEILEDISKQKWKLGVSIGKGGFGEIYSAQEFNTTKNTTFPYVIKIEPHANGPLFVEMHFFVRNAKKADVDMFMASKKLKSFGMPIYCGSGSHEHNGTKYRFIVMERFGSDLWKIFLENKRSFSPGIVYKIAIQILDVLEYIHSKGYVHADIKGANILLDLKNKNQVYLVDFGLATRYFVGDKFKPDPKKAHDGTIEYLSRDAHKGVQTRRGDLEILIYNIIQWLGCTLPWEKEIKNPVNVQESKEKYMNDVSLLIKTCFGKNKPPETVLNLLKYHKTLNFDTDIDYKKVRRFLEKGLEYADASLNSPYQFKTTKSPIKRRSTAETPLSGKKKKMSRRKLLESCTDESEEDKENTDSEEMEKEHTPKIRSATPKKRGRKLNTKKVEKEIDDLGEEKGDNPGYTAEMKRIMDKIKVSNITKGRSRVKMRKEADQEDVASPIASSSNVTVRGRRNRNKINYDEKINNSESE